MFGVRRRQLLRAEQRIDGAFGLLVARVHAGQSLQRQRRLRLGRRQAIEGVDRLVGLTRGQLRAPERVEDAGVLAERGRRLLRGRQGRARIAVAEGRD